MDDVPAYPTFNEVPVPEVKPVVVKIEPEVKIQPLSISQSMTPKMLYYT
jgi:hypothetical protein